MSSKQREPKKKAQGGGRQNPKGRLLTVRKGNSEPKTVWEVDFHGGKWKDYVVV